MRRAQVEHLTSFSLYLNRAWFRKSNHILNQIWNLQIQNVAFWFNQWICHLSKIHEWYFYELSRSVSQHLFEQHSNLFWKWAEALDSHCQSSRSIMSCWISSRHQEMWVSYYLNQVLRLHHKYWWNKNKFQKNWNYQKLTNFYNNLKNIIFFEISAIFISNLLKNTAA